MTSRFGNLDGLRFICISMVLWHHAQPIDTADFPFLQRGFLGVDFFFVLSGYLITTILLREAEREGKFSLRKFYLRRILRIAPVYFFVVSTVAFYYIAIKGQTDLLKLVPFYFLFLSNFLTTHIPTLSPTWSLAVEEQYYMVWPLLMLLFSLRTLVPVCILLITINVVAILNVIGLEPIVVGPLVIKMPNATYAPLIMGSLAAIALHQRKSFGLVFAIAGHWSAIAIAGLSLLLAIQFSPPDLRGLPNFVLHIFMTLTLITLVVREKTLITPFLTQSIVQRIGAISYGIYLYHLLALDVATRFLTIIGLRNDWTVFLGYFVLSCLIAEISFRSLEAWFQKYRPR